MKNSRAKQEMGQGLVEYALVLVLVAIVVIAVMMLIGPIIGNTFSSINNDLDVYAKPSIIEARVSPAVPGMMTSSGHGHGNDETAEKARESFEKWREEWEKMYENGSEAFQLSREIGEEFFEFLGERFDEDEEFQAAIDTAEQEYRKGNYDQASETLAPQLEKLNQLAPEDWLRLIEKFTKLLPQRCEHLEGARVTPDLIEHYNAARVAFAELPNGDQLVARADEIQDKILLWDEAASEAEQQACPQPPE